jgi:hypothetical protein
MAAIRTSDSSGYTTVMGACDSPAMRFEGRQPLAVVRKLLDIGVPINQAAYSQHLLRPPIRLAFLIRPPTHTSRQDGSTALYMAAMHRLGDVVEELISRGADVHASVRRASLLQVEDVSLLLLYLM